MGFVAIDVETANADLASICQIGLASFQGETPEYEFKSLINPEDDFDALNISIHGIDEEMVKNSPNWKEIHARVNAQIRGKIVVCHTAFDRVATHRVCEKYKLPEYDCIWLDSARVVRRTWQKFAKSGYGLQNVAEELGIKYSPHDALEDALCAGQILNRAIAESGLSVEQWLNRVKLPIGQEHGGPINREGCPEGPLHGEVVVFTGTLSMLRREAANLAAAAGCEVTDAVSKHTTLLVVGNQDIKRLAGHTTSRKQRRAEELIKAGQNIRILTESDFQRAVRV